MPQIRPEAISNRVRLAYEVRAAVRGLISEKGAVDAGLPAIVGESSPRKAGVSAVGSQHNFFAGAAKEFAHSAVCVSVGGVVPLIEFQAVNVAVLRQPPVRVRSNNGMQPTHYAFGSVVG